MLRRAYPPGFQLLVTLAYLITSPFSLLTDHPCRCLWRGFLQITRTTFLRFTILHDSHRRLTEARTFIGSVVQLFKNLRYNRRRSASALEDKKSRGKSGLSGATRVSQLLLSK